MREIKRNILRRLQTVKQSHKDCRLCTKGEGDLHSASTKGFSFTKAGNVPPVREETSEADVTAAPRRPSAKGVKARMLAVFEEKRPVIEMSVAML